MTLRGTVELLQPFEDGFRIKLPDGEVRHNGEAIGFRIWAYFRAAAASKLSKVSAGDTVVLVGLMRRADLRLYEGDRWPSLSIDIADTEIYLAQKAPNHALQRTATVAFSYRCAAVSSTGSVTACAPAMKPGTCRAFALRRRAHPRAFGSRSLSLGSLGVSEHQLSFTL